MESKDEVVNDLKKYTKLVIEMNRQEKKCQKLKDELRKEWRQYYLLQEKVDSLAYDLGLELCDENPSKQRVPKRTKIEL